MKNLNNEKIRRVVNEMATGQAIFLPQWASFLLYTSRLVRSPVFVVPLVVAIAVVGLIVQWDFRLIATFTLLMSAIWLPLITIITTNQMRAEGVLDSYMAMIASETLFGRFLVARFGRQN